MIALGYTASSEEHPPDELVANVRAAEEAGFDFCSMSDHFHPWVQEQGHSPFVWAVLGGVAAATENIEVVTGVTCPTLRMHPVINAHAAATTAILFGGRFSFGVGSGEALNEHVTGANWPSPEVRLEMLEEAVGLIRELWTGETVDHRGRHYTAENARLFDPPDPPPPLLVSGFGQKSVELAARIGDGLFSHADAEIAKTFKDAGGTGPLYAQLNVCWGPDKAKCAETVHRIWPNSAIPGQLSQELPMWSHFEQAAQLVTQEDAVQGVTHGSDIEEYVKAFREYVDAGFDHVYFHQIGPDQAGFLEAWRGELGAAIREAAGSK